MQLTRLAIKLTALTFVRTSELILTTNARADPLKSDKNAICTRAPAMANRSDYKDFALWKARSGRIDRDFAGR